MKNAFTALALIAATGLLSGCQTALLRSPSESTASATVKHPVIFGDTRITVSLNGKHYTGVVGELNSDITGYQAQKFGWKPDHRHPNIKQEMKFLFGTTTLTADDGTSLSCDHLKHGDDWRLRCKTADELEISLYRVLN